MNFEQLLDGATKGPWNAEAHPADRTVHIYGPAPDCRLVCELSPHSRFDQMQIDADAELIARCNPAVMREVWAALKEGAEPSNWFFDEGAYQMVCRKDVRTRCTRALALLDGQTEKGGAE